MNTTLKRVFVSGSFDDLRTRDIRFLQEAAALGEVHAMLLSDSAARTREGKPVKFPLAERKYFLENIRFVEEVHIIPSAASMAEIVSGLLKEGGQNLWAGRENAIHADVAQLCEEMNIMYESIPEANLDGYPLVTGQNGRTRKKVMVSGCFDWVHSGHVRFFEEASQFGGLYVVVGHDDNLRLLKGDGHPLFSQEERQYWVQSIRFVHQALISSGHGWLDAEPEMRSVRPDVFIVNHDGDKPEKKDLCDQLGIAYQVLARKPKPGLKARMSTNLRGF